MTNRIARISRRRLLIGAGVGVMTGALLVEGAWLAPDRLDVTRHRLGTDGPGRSPIRLAVITDLHLKGIDAFHEGIVNAVGDLEPDAILLVGDCVDDPVAIPLLREFLDLLPTAPRSFATLGNWEYWSGVDPTALRRAFDDGGVHLLVNEAAEIRPGAWLYGLDDSLAGRPDLAGARTVAETHGGPPTLLLSHCPDYRDRLSADEAALFAGIISGHTHGGQVAIGGWAPLRPPGSGRYVSGWYRDPGLPDLFVSRGLGTSMVPVRLGSDPELALVEWYPDEGGPPSASEPGSPETAS